MQAQHTMSCDTWHPVRAARVRDHMSCGECGFALEPGCVYRFRGLSDRAIGPAGMWRRSQLHPYIRTRNHFVGTYVGRDGSASMRFDNCRLWGGDADGVADPSPISMMIVVSCDYEYATVHTDTRRLLTEQLARNWGADVGALPAVAATLVSRFLDARDPGRYARDERRNTGVALVRA